MIRFLSLMFISLFLLPLTSHGQMERLNDKYDLGEFQIVKISVGLTELSPGSLIGSYETGAGMAGSSLNISLRLNPGPEYLPHIKSRMAGDDSLRINYNAHVRIEVQGRYWLMDQFRGLFAGPKLSWYSTHDFSAGAVIGYQHFFNENFTFDVFMGVSFTGNKNLYGDTAFQQLGLNFGFPLN